MVYFMDISFVKVSCLYCACYDEHSERKQQHVFTALLNSTAASKIRSIYHICRIVGSATCLLRYTTLTRQGVLQKWRSLTKFNLARLPLINVSVKAMFLVFLTCSFFGSTLWCNDGHRSEISSFIIQIQGAIVVVPLSYFLDN